MPSILILRCFAQIEVAGWAACLFTVGICYKSRDAKCCQDFRIGLASISSAYSEQERPTDCILKGLSPSTTGTANSNTLFGQSLSAIGNIELSTASGRGANNEQLPKRISVATIKAVGQSQDSEAPNTRREGCETKRPGLARGLGHGIREFQNLATLVKNKRMVTCIKDRDIVTGEWVSTLFS